MLRVASELMQRRRSWRAPRRIRRGLVAACLAVAIVPAMGATAPRPGPAPIVVSGSGSGPVRVSQGGRERIVDPDDARGRVTTRVASSGSAFDVPEPTDDSFETEALDQAANDAAPQAPSSSDTVGRSGYRPSSSLNQRLPGASADPFAKGYAPSSSLTERMTRQATASSQMGAWPAANLADPRTVDQWRARGSQSRSGKP